MLLRKTLAFLPAQLFGPLLQFLLAVLLTHWLAPAAYGTTMLVIAAQEFVYLIGLSWWTHYTMRYLTGFTSAEDRARYQRVENTVLLISSAAQTLAAIAMLAIIEAPWSWPLIGATIAFTVTRSLLSHLSERARSAGAVTDYTIGQLAGPGLGLVFAIASFPILSAEAATVLGAFALAQALAVGLLAWRLGLRGQFGRMDRPILIAAFAFGGPLLISGGFVWLSANAIRLIVNTLEGAVQLGLISVAWALGQRLASVAAMLVTAAAYPLAVKAMAAGDPRRAMAQISSNGALLFAVLAPATAGLMLIGRPLVELAVAPAFREATVALLPLCVLCGAIRNLRIHFVDQAFLLNEAPRAIMVITAIEAAITVVAVAIGVAFASLSGGVIGACFGAAIGLALAYASASRRFGLAIPTGDIVRVGLATGAMTLALVALDWSQSPGGLLAEISAGVLAYALVLAPLYPSVIRGLVRQRLRPA